MSCELLALSLDAHAPDRLAAFWAGLLDRPVVEEGDAFVLPGSDVQVGLEFVRSDSVKAGPNRVHLHLTSTSAEDQRRQVDNALALGGSHLDVGQLPDEGHIVLVDPEGNEFCVIEAGNAFLAGCGLLGELACDGTRDVGVFWSAVTTWPLVWNQDEETAIQAPGGGTKVSWGGPPLAAKTGPNRQGFHLVVTDGDLGSEIDRLTSLGATLGESAGDKAQLADPDGNEFVLSAAPR